jgi:hypothetical protein
MFRLASLKSLPQDEISSGKQWQTIAPFSSKKTTGTLVNFIKNLHEYGDG